MQNIPKFLNNVNYNDTLHKFIDIHLLHLYLIINDKIRIIPITYG